MAVEYATRAELRAGRRDATDVAAFLRRLDWILVASVVALIAYGLWAIAGITRHDVPGNPNYYVVREGIFVAIGVVALIAALVIDPDWYRRRWRPIYGGTIAVMALVFLRGVEAHGSRRWLSLGFFRFQPSEFGKVLFVLALASFVAGRTKQLGAWRTTLHVVGLALIPIVLVLKEPDAGTAMVYLAALAAVLFVAGIRWLQLAALGIAAALVATIVLWAAPAVGVPILPHYQVERLTGFFHPSADPTGQTYNIIQSKNAVGSGEIYGRGPNGSTQVRFDFLPAHYTDFVFASLSEERGFVGASILLALYLLVIWRGIRIIAVARDAFSAIVAGGIVFALLFQIFVNVGMTMGIAPITGIPLPFLSVGGSSMIANLLAIGILLSIHARARVRR